MKQLDIAEVAQRSGVPASTLRYYDEKGLIASIGRHGLRAHGVDHIRGRTALAQVVQNPVAQRGLETQHGIHARAQISAGIQPVSVRLKFCFNCIVPAPRTTRSTIGKAFCTSASPVHGAASILYV